MHETLNSGIAPPALIRVNDKRPPAVSHLHDRKQDVAMAMNVEASFWGMQTSLSAEAQLRERAAELEQFSDRICACRVMLEATHRHHRSGTIYCVSADLALPGGKIVANREPGKDHAREDMHVAIRDAFDAARRRLQDHRRRMEGEVKEHPAATTGRIVRLFADRGYGFLVTDAGDEVYLHRNCVNGGGFDSLTVGDHVRYVLDTGEGDNGPPASAVTPLGAHTSHAMLNHAQQRRISMINSGPHPATASDIRAMVGDLDDVVIGSIAATGASLAEVALAVEWLRGDRGLEDETGHEPHGVTRAVYDILRAEEIDDV
jgi:cold shock CspA family protein/ribosome-associated translation inhibitor RaiA